MPDLIAAVVTPLTHGWSPGAATPRPSGFAIVIEFSTAAGIGQGVVRRVA